MASTSQESLHSPDMSQFHDFTRRHDWINDQIALLQSLPSVDPFFVNPDNASLRLQIHQIQQQADEFDASDLAALRKLAKAKSRHRLSAQDADLIELALKTLFAFDRLLQLLASHNKALKLLELFQLWQTQLQAMHAESTAVWENIVNVFIPKARYVVHPNMRRLSADANALNPFTRSIQPQSSTTMSRTMRSELLGFDVARQINRINTLLGSQMAHCAKCLDTIIDTSPTAIPDQFLDQQDDMEQMVKSDFEGIIPFLSHLVAQWKECDAFHHRIESLDMNIQEFSREIAAATLTLPDIDTATAYATKSAQLSQELHNLSVTLQSSLSLAISKPQHPRTPDQSAFNLELLHTFTSLLRNSEGQFSKLEKTIISYQNSAKALQESQVLEPRLVESRTRLQSINLPSIQLPEVSIDQDTQTTLTHTPLDAYQTQAKQAQLLVSQAFDCLASLKTGGVDPNIRRNLREVAISLQKECETLQQKLAEHARLQGVAEEAQDLIANLRAVLEQIGTAEDLAIHSRCLVPPLLSAIIPPLDPSTLTSLNSFRSHFDSSILPRLKPLDTYSTYSTGIQSSIQDLQSRIHTRESICKLQQSLLQEASALASFDDTISSIQSDIIVRRQRMLELSPDLPTSEQDLRLQLENLHRSIAGQIIEMPVVYNITLPFDTEEHHKQVRSRVNSSHGAILGQLDDLNKLRNYTEHIRSQQSECTNLLHVLDGGYNESDPSMIQSPDERVADLLTEAEVLEKQAEHFGLTNDSLILVQYNATLSELREQKEHLQAFRARPESGASSGLAVEPQTPSALLHVASTSPNDSLITSSSEETHVEAESSTSLSEVDLEGITHLIQPMPVHKFAPFPSTSATEEALQKIKTHTRSNSVIHKATEAARDIDVGELQSALQRQLDLANVGEQVRQADAQLSDLMNLLDEDQSTNTGCIPASTTAVLKKAKGGIARVRSASVGLEDDARVQHHVSRLENMLEEMEAIVEHGGQVTELSRTSSRLSLAQSVSSSSISSLTKEHMPPPSYSSRRLSQIPIASPRSKSVAFPLPKPPPTRNLRTSIGLGLPPLSALKARSVSDNIHQKSSFDHIGQRRSHSSSTRPRYSSSASRSTAPPSRYRAAKRPLDIAVGKVVNEFDIHIPISPATHEAYEDLSGKYWIGDKLYFARILRSKTVMVRVGGGWQELSSFLQTHYGTIHSPTYPSTPPRSPRARLSSSPHWFRGQDLRRSTSAQTVLTQDQRRLSIMRASPDLHRSISFKARLSSSSSAQSASTIPTKRATSSLGQRAPWR